MIHHSIKYYIKQCSEKKGFAFVRKLVHGLLSECVGYGYEILCKLHICQPKIIVMIDGGICSQMHQYLIGQQFNHQGVTIEYDLSWFESRGVDVDGKFSRDYELEKMFPNLEVNKSNKFTTWFYSVFLDYIERDFSSTNAYRYAPIYLGGYYDMDDHVFSQLFNEIFCYRKHPDVPMVLKSSENQMRCAIHVRRGDLASGDNPWYGGVSEGYFYNAIDTVEKIYPGTKYYFFSDEMDYVANNIAPNLKVEYELIYGPHKAYEDLVLISQCEIIVASQGSFGKYAAMLNTNSILILENNKYAEPWLKRKAKTILI